jgi:DNA polymerase I-like protein with 3'-5' exonuclease and polymerase domains
MHAYGYEHKGSTRDTLHLKYLVHFASGERKPENGKLMVPAWLPKRKIEGEKKAISEGTLRLLALDYLGEEVDKGQQTSDWLAEELDAEQVTYAAKDTSILFRLWDRLMEEYLSIADEALAKIGRPDIDPEMVIRLDGDDLPAKTWMEGNGFAINAEKWQALAREYKAIRIAAEEELFSLAGKGPDELNLGSDVQIIEVLESLGADLSKVPKTKKTQRPSLAADNIKKAKGPAKVQRFIELHQQRENAAKNETTYGEKWLMSPEEIAADPRFKKDQVPALHQKSGLDTIGSS